MTAYQVSFSPSSEKEIEESFDWYEERSIGLGIHFVEIKDEALDAILSSPESYQKRSARHREFVVDKFPYIIVYEIDNNANLINVIHVFHTSRNPKLKYKNK